MANNLPGLAERSHMIYVNNEFSFERLVRVKSKISHTFVDRKIWFSLEKMWDYEAIFCLGHGKGFEKNEIVYVVLCKLFVSKLGTWNISLTTRIHSWTKINK